MLHSSGYPRPGCRIPRARNAKRRRQSDSVAIGTVYVDRNDAAMSGAQKHIQNVISESSPCLQRKNTRWQHGPIIQHWQDSSATKTSAKRTSNTLERRNEQSARQRKQQKHPTPTRALNSTNTAGTPTRHEIENLRAGQTRRMEVFLPLVLRRRPTRLHAAGTDPSY